MTEQYVVDTSVVMQRLIVEVNTSQVRRLFAEMTQGTVLVVPEFCLLECANVLWKQVRFQGMPQSTAEHLLIDFVIAAANYASQSIHASCPSNWASKSTTHL
ncbi:MAG: type II toxin-antitoxin system VapC family toxin [Leptolyngbyaceae cyanobacterium RM1_406_9]|nr:type II toxin-antitoxin system VapC family toxin [Leptolyngbyaceae cyanobacterium RM1_406_9]